MTQHGPELKAQLATYIEQPFVEATYKTETDASDAAFLLFETVEGLTENIRVCRGYHPTNLGLPNAVIRARLQQQYPAFTAPQIDGLVNAAVAQQRRVRARVRILRATAGACGPSLPEPTAI